MTTERPLFRTPPPGPVSPPAEETLEQKMQRLQEIEDRIRVRTGLPFLYGWKWYSWAKAFYESTNHINLLCAANQISKSSTQIRKCINWATDQKLWPDLWATRPVQFWYLYPTQKQVNAEFETKWKQFLPNGEYKDDPYYGWKVESKKGDILAINFNSGVHVYFKTYEQNVSALQSGTVDALFCDEELPIDLYEELMFRISASNGYFHMVFTATLGQEQWRMAMEPEEGEKEFLADAFKQTVSMYDCMVYEDGTPSQWTAERIKIVEARCPTQNEVLKRVFGKFIVIGGRKYESFDLKRHKKDYHPVPKNWLIFGGADPGSGGQDGHPSALAYVAVRPDFRAGRVFCGWRGDGIVTTAGDVVEKHIAIKKEEKFSCTRQFYDWGSKDFFNIATRMGESFEKADKSHDVGEDIINTLFKNDMMYVYDTPELGKLCGELASLKKKTSKRNAKDDFTDAFRYAVTKIPWDWSFITGAKSDLDENPEEPLNATQREIAERRKAFDDDQNAEEQRIEDEFNEWNDIYGS